MTEPSQVRSRTELLTFVRKLHERYVADRDAWENNSLDRFLEALAAWIDDLPGWFRNRGQDEPEQPDWGLVADMLTAATMYE